MSEVRDVTGGLAVGLFKRREIIAEDEGSERHRSGGARAKEEWK